MALRMEHAEAGSTDQDGYGSKRQSMSVDTDASAQRRAPEGETPDRDRTVERAAGLEDAVRGAVIPRLYARKSLSGCDKALSESQPADAGLSHFHTRHAAERLRGLLLAARDEEQVAFLTEMRRTLSLSILISDVVAPVMEEIGIEWEEDRMSFAEVTLLSTRLQRGLSLAIGRGESETVTRAARRSDILLAVMPGEQHSIGIDALSALLSESGHHVDRMASATLEELRKRISEHTYRILGLSCGSDRTRPALRETIASLRDASKNRQLCIFLGGRALHSVDESIDNFGADLIVTDGRRAVDLVSDALRR